MADQESSNKHNHKKWKSVHHSTPSGAIYGLGILGVAVYYIQHAANFWEGILGIIKAIFWPAILLYHLFAMLRL